MQEDFSAPERLQRQPEVGKIGSNPDISSHIWQSMRSTSPERGGKAKGAGAGDQQIDFASDDPFASGSKSQEKAKSIEKPASNNGQQLNKDGPSSDSGKGSKSDENAVRINQDVSLSAPGLKPGAPLSAERQISISESLNTSRSRDDHEKASPDAGAAQNAADSIRLDTLPPATNDAIVKGSAKIGVGPDGHLINHSTGENLRIGGVSGLPPEGVELKLGSTPGVHMTADGSLSALGVKSGNPLTPGQQKLIAVSIQNHESAPSKESAGQGVNPSIAESLSHGALSPATRDAVSNGGAKIAVGADGQLINKSTGESLRIGGVSGLPLEGIDLSSGNK